jgi:hypothetical protein
MTSARLCIVPGLQVSYLPTLLFITARDNTARPIDDSSLGPHFSNNSSASNPKSAEMSELVGR